MRSYWVLFALILVLVVLAGIGTADLMWGGQPHVVQELKLADAYAPDAPVDEDEQVPELPPWVEEDTVASLQ